MPVALPQELLDFQTLIGSQIKRHLDRINDQNYLNRRIGPGRESIERVKGKNLLRMVVVQQSKVLGSEATYWVLAVQSGGRVLGPDDNLVSQIDSCVQEASAFYTLIYKPDWQVQDSWRRHA